MALSLHNTFFCLILSSSLSLLAFRILDLFLTFAQIFLGVWPIQVWGFSHTFPLRFNQNKNSLSMVTGFWKQMILLSDFKKKKNRKNITISRSYSADVVCSAVMEHGDEAGCKMKLTALEKWSFYNYLFIFWQTNISSVKHKTDTQIFKNKKLNLISLVDLQMLLSLNLNIC